MFSNSNWKTKTEERLWLKVTGAHLIDSVLSLESQRELTLTYEFCFFLKLRLTWKYHYWTLPWNYLNEERKRVKTKVEIVLKKSELTQPKFFISELIFDSELTWAKLKAKASF